MTRSWRAVVDLPVEPTAPAAASGFIRELLHAWGQTDLVEDAQLVVTELVANAVQHAADSPTFTLLVCSGRHGAIDLALTDGSTITPIIRELSPDHPTGRGMRLVQSLTSSWGAKVLPTGKQVWVELRRPPPAEDTKAG